MIQSRTSNQLGRLGVEIELLAPPCRSRQDFASAIAERHGGEVRRFFHPQGEPSKAENTPVFDNLTLGFVAEDRQGATVAQFVDDLTLQANLDRKAVPKPGWYRIVSDDSRLLRLTMRHADPAAPLETVLQPIADLFGTRMTVGAGGMVRVADESGAPVVLGARLPGERERPCELITPPLESDHLERLSEFIAIARELEFSVPAEAALHLHFDATPLHDAAAVSNLVRFLGFHSEALKKRYETNSRCVRLGDWPDQLYHMVCAEAFLDLGWDEARQALCELKLSKFCDFNLRNLVHEISGKHTFEVRILPVWMDAGKIIEAAEFFSAILRWASDEPGRSKDVPDDPEAVL